jgi:hypothetical protein
MRALAERNDNFLCRHNYVWTGTAYNEQLMDSLIPPSKRENLGNEAPKLYFHSQNDICLLNSYSSLSYVSTATSKASSPHGAV